MRLLEVIATIDDDHGYLVHFEKIDGSFLKGDYFPDVHGGEEPFGDMDEAINTVMRYAKATKGKTCNFYLVRSDNFRPTGAWKLDNRGGYMNNGDMLEFGDYCKIEQKRYGVPNEIYRYKVIGRSKCNYYHPAPVDASGNHKAYGDMCDVVKVICMGVIEEKVQTFRLCDVLPDDSSKTSFG